MVQATGITGVVESISPSPAYWGCIENFTNAPAESRIANKLHTKNHMKFHTILLNELLETLKMVSTLPCLCSQDHVPRADGHYICARADGHARVGLCEGDDVVCSVPDEHHMGLAFGASSGTGLLFFLEPSERNQPLAWACTLQWRWPLVSPADAEEGESSCDEDVLALDELEDFELHPDAVPRRGIKVIDSKVRATRV